MKYDYDLICIGLGPAGMAVSIMASSMGLKVAAIEKNAIGGECMHVGCIPSKALLHVARARNFYSNLADYGLSPVEAPKVNNPFAIIQQHLSYISEKKTSGMFDKVDVFLRQGSAVFIDAHRVKVGEKTMSAKRIFVATGTRPMVLPIPGIASIKPLTNENVFKLQRIPPRLIVLGGGAIACELSQAFQRLGSQVTIIQRSACLLSAGEPSAAAILQNTLQKEGVRVLTGHQPARIEKQGDAVALYTDKGTCVVGDELLVATGRKLDYKELELDKAGVAVGGKGQIMVNKFLQTSQRSIYAVGDCNGYHLFSHAAMHQGMIALMNSMAPWPFKQDFRKFVVPSTVFTEPQISHVGRHAAELTKHGIPFETIETKYADYGAAIAENLTTGFIRVYVSRTGRILGADIVGDGSGEMINEWALAIQKNIRIHDIMMLQHSFPTMGFMSKRIGEIWMMNKMKSPTLKKIASAAFRWG